MCLLSDYKYRAARLQGTLGICYCSHISFRKMAHMPWFVPQEAPSEGLSQEKTSLCDGSRRARAAIVVSPLPSFFFFFLKKEIRIKKSCNASCMRVTEGWASSGDQFVFRYLLKILFKMFPAGYVKHSLKAWLFSIFVFLLTTKQHKPTFD